MNVTGILQTYSYVLVTISIVAMRIRKKVKLKRGEDIHGNLTAKQYKIGYVDNLLYLKHQ
jgi:hypothetical protein